MWINSILFAAGMLLCQQLAELPSLALLLPPLVMTIAILGYLGWHQPTKPPVTFKPGVISALFLAWGFLWAAVYGHWLLSDRLSPELVKQPLVITGSIDDLPLKKGHNWQFNFRIEHGLLKGEKVQLPKLVRLGWYRTRVELESGQQWRLTVKLKPPTGLRNPGLFDYETWLFSQRIGARGYVIDNAPPDRPADGPLNKKGQSNWLRPVAGFREKVRRALDSFDDYPHATAMIKALTIGDKSSIQFSQWQTFRNLGINHLVAISGLHIGMIATLFYLLSGFLWKRSAWLCTWIPAVKIQAISALFAATFYAAMAGFSIPTQRALVMLLLLLGSQLLLINMQPRRQLAVAFIVLLLWDPMAVISPGFWLSFTAVAAIFMVLQADNTKRPEQYSRSQLLDKMRQLIALQWHISLALVPLQVFYFSQVSLLAPLINLVLIPLFGFVIVPISLLLAAILSIEATQYIFAATWMQTIIHGFLEWLEKLIAVLGRLAQIEGISVSTNQVGWPVFIALIAVVALWFLFRQWWIRVISLLLVFLLLFIPQHQLADGQLRMTVLDVGQGTAVVVEKKDYLFLYDLGPRYGQGKSATSSVVIPYLQNKRIKRIDQLVVSHADSDHAGDFNLLIKQFDVVSFLSGERLKNSQSDYRLCAKGERWQVGKTLFEVLHPKAGNWKAAMSGNNASCVIRISHGGRRILLSGDIERSIEHLLVKTYQHELAADIALVPHHGSLTSSTSSFIRHVSASLVINTSGYLNRYQFPRDSVMQRWQQAGAIFLDTGKQGALQIVLDEAGNLRHLSAEGLDNQRYWHTAR